MGRKRGASLGLALTLIGLAMLAAFTLAATSSANLQVAQRVENNQVASELAESAVQRATAMLMTNNAWQGDISIAGPVAGSTGTLTFRRDQPAYSTNNVDGTHANGWPDSRVLPQTVVPAGRVHLVGVGRCRNAVKTVEAVVHMPNFTVSVAANGKVVLENSLVGSLKDPADLASLSDNPELLGPGDLATNDRSATAVKLDQSSRVTGNVQSCGGVQVLNGSLVEGEVRAPWKRSDIPDFDLHDYDPETTDALNFQTLSPGIATGQDLVGLVRCGGNVRVQGDLSLDNALFYVDGDLVVDGGVRGTGAVMVDGKTTIKGGVSLTSDDSIALLSQDDVTLIGDQPDRYQFHGLIYTRGNFDATNFTVVGSFIANGTGPGSGGIALHDSQLYYTSVNARVPVFYPRQLVLQIAGVNPPEQHNLPLDDGNQIEYGNFPGSAVPQQYNIPWKTPAEAAAHVNGQPYQGWEDADGGPWHWYDTVVLEVRKENDQFAYYLTYNPHPIAGAATYPERFTDQSALIERLTQISLQMCPDYNDGVDPGGPNNYETPEYRRTTFYPNLLAAWSLEQPPPGTPIQLNFSFDPNRFLKQQDKVRIAAWLEY